MAKAAKSLADDRRHDSREAEEREFEDRDSEFLAPEGWTPPSVLDAPAPLPGMRQRWVSTSILGKDVPHHVMKRFREGWTPRPASTVPKGFPIPKIDYGDHGEVVGVEGHILCHMPEERVKAREAYFQGKTRDQTEFVEAQLQSTQNPVMPIHQDRRSTASRGSRVKVMDD